MGKNSYNMYNSDKLQHIVKHTHVHVHMIWIAVVIANMT